MHGSSVSVPRRSILGILAIVIVTTLSIGSIAVNGVDQAFTVDQFYPDSEAVEGGAILQDEFEYLTNVGLLTEFRWSANDPDKGIIEGNLRKDQFLKVLEFERSLVEDDKIGPMLARPIEPGATIVSPVNLVSIALYNTQIVEKPDRWNRLGLDLEILKDPETGEPVIDGEGNVTLYPPLTYDNLIIFMGSSYSQTFFIHMAINQMLTGDIVPEEYQDDFKRLFSKDLQYLGTPVNASATMSFIRIDPSLTGGGLNSYNLEIRLSEMGKVASDDTLKFTVVGQRILEHDIASSAFQDLFLLFPVVAVATIMLLWLLLRDLPFIIMSLTCLGAAIAWVYGFGAAWGITFSPLAVAVPFMVLGVGMDFSIHMLLGYRKQREEFMDHNDSLDHMMRKVGGAIFLATVTTCIAYLSNIVSDMEGVIQFGILNAVGIFSAFIILLVIVPSFLNFRARISVTAPPPRTPMLDTVVRSVCTRIRANGPRLVALLAVLSLVLSMYAVNIQFDFRAKDFIPAGSESEYAIYYISENFNATGFVTVDVLIKGPMEDPSLVQNIQDSMDMMVDNRYVVQMGGLPKVSSVFSVMREWANEFFLGDPRYDPDFADLYSLHFDPDDGRYLGDADTEYLASLIEAVLDRGMMREEFLAYRSTDGRFLRLSVQVQDVLGVASIIDMRDSLADDMSPVRDAGHNVILTSTQLINSDIIEAMQGTLVISVVLTLSMALLVVCGLNILRGREMVMGVMAILPAALTIIWIWGLLNLMGIALNPVTMTVAALIVGLGVDYGIHITHRFQLEVGGSGIDKALSLTMEETGKGVIIGAVTTALGFGMMGMISIRPISEFGLITMASVTGVAVMSLFLLPPLMAAWARRRGFKD